jgi:hypothetical protein
MFKGKPTTVRITKEAKNELDILHNIVDEEITKGISSSEHQTVLHSIQQKIEILKSNPEYGIHIPKNRIPKIYVQNYAINNLWKINLSSAWRMTYTIRGNAIEIISLILDIMNHSDYEKKFRYKKK